MFVKARTGWNDPIYKSFIVRQKACDFSTLTLNAMTRPLLVATASVGASLLASTETISSLYTNSEQYLCADYEYTFLDAD